MTWYNNIETEKSMHNLHTSSSGRQIKQCLEQIQNNIEIGISDCVQIVVFIYGLRI